MVFICPSTYAMNMTRTWSDHYKLVILERKGTKGQRHRGTKKERAREATCRADGGQEAQRRRGAKAQSRKTILLYPFVPLSLCIFVPSFLCAYVPLFLGRMRVKVLPCPEVLVTVMAPWWARAKALARLRPRPVPG